MHLPADAGVGEQVIVGQGQLDSVLHADPAGRRAFIEEAAGVLKHRKRKERSERRLAATEGNLLRLGDLLRELRRQLRPLERQAEAARRHGDLVTELVALQVYVAGKELQTLKARLTAATTERAQLRESEAAAVRTLSQLDSSVLSAEGRLAAQGGDDLGDLLAQFESLHERARGMGTLLAERGRGLERERDAAVDQGIVANLEAESARLREELAELDAEAATKATADATVAPGGAAAALEAAARRREAAQVAVAEAEEARRDAEADLRSWQARRDALNLALESARSRAGAQRLAGVEGVLGTLLDVVEVDAGWEAAFEAAAGDALVATLVSGTDAARRALSALAGEDLTGAVIALGGARGASRPPAVGVPVRSHVRSERPEVEALLDALVGATVVVDGGWSEALDAALAHPEATVVTTTGDRFGPTGWRVGQRSTGATGAALAEAEAKVESSGPALDEAVARHDAARHELEEARHGESELRTDLEVRTAALAQRRQLLGGRLEEVERRLEGVAAQRAEAESNRVGLDARIVATRRLSAYAAARSKEIEVVLEDLRSMRKRQSDMAREAVGELDELRRRRRQAEGELVELREKLRRTEITEAEVRLRMETAVEALRRDLDTDPQAAMAAELPELPEGTNPSARVRELERELRIMGPVNPLALEEFEALQERHQFLQEQLDDVKASRRELSKIIRAIDAEIVSVFAAAFADVSANFEHLFGTLFPGGTGRLRLTDPENLLETGIDVEAKPSGKNVKKLSLLSGGERSLTALAFLFAVFRSRPSPFYVMDEVEAALDDVNLHRFLDLIKEFRQEAQLIIVSHQRRTMESADCLYGVSMQPGGSSKVISEKVGV